MRDPEPIEIDDKRLVERYLRRRDEGAFRHLYRRHTAALYAVVLRFVGGRASDAEDVIQETWVRAAVGLATFRWDSSLRTWLTGIAINCARNRTRAHARREGPALADVTELPAPDPLEREIGSVDIERAVERLPDGFRDVLVLHDVFGYTHKEIASVLGIEVGTSKSQLSRARSTVRRWLSEPGENRNEGRSEQRTE